MINKDSLTHMGCLIIKPFTQWERLRHPYAGWARLALALLFPIVVWSHSLLLILLFIGAALAHPYWFPPYVEAGDDMPVMTRLTDAAQKWLEPMSMEEKIIAFFPGLVLFLPLLSALWDHSLFWSFYFFLAIATYKAMILLRLMDRAKITHDDGDDDDKIHA